MDRKETILPEPSESIRQLANRIWLRHVEEDSSELIRLPGERQLSRTFKATRYAIDNALNLLERDGRLVRMSRSGSFVRRTEAPSPSSPMGLRCINFLQPPGLLAEQMHWLAADMLAGYTAALEHHHVKTRFTACTDEHEDFESLFWPQEPLRSQACVLMNRRAPALLHWLSERGIPFVEQCGYHYDDTGLPPHHRVYINKAGGAFAAVRHLLDLGHRRIGFLGEMPGGPGAWPVYEGYRAALRCAGLEPDPNWTVRLFTDDPMWDQTPVVECLRRPNRPTAMLTGNDYTAIAVLNAARTLNIAVPRELSVMGVNDQKEAAEATPPLTTVAIPRRELGRTAVELLLAAAEGRTQGWETRILECSLVIRKTTAPPM